MATYTPVRLAGPTALTASAAAIYTVGTGKTAALKWIMFNNTSASAVTVTVHLVPSGGSVLTSNQIISSLSIPAYGQIPWAMDIPMATGDAIQAFASTNAAIVTVASGFEIQ